MSIEQETLNIPVNVDQQKNLQKLTKQLQDSAQALKNMAAEVKTLGQGFSSIQSNVSKAATTMRVFTKALTEMGKGDALMRTNQMVMTLTKNLGKAADNMQILRYKEKTQNIGNYSVLDKQIKAQELRAGEARYASELNRTNAQLKERVKVEERALASLKEQEQVIKRIRNIEQQTSSNYAKANDPRFQASQKAMTEARLFSDGGAHLFKIQAELLLNYTLMNQLFNLYNFGTQYVVQLDLAFRDLQAITNTTNLGMESLKDRIIEVSQSTRFSAVEVAEAAKILAQAGFSAQQIKDSIQGVTLLATATGTDLATSVDVASSVISIFELKAEDMGHVANVLTGALNETKLTMDKVALGMQYAGNIAAEAGLSFDETTAILGAMANAGIRSGSTLGTGLRQVLIELMNPTDKLVKKLDEVGLTVADVDVKSRGFVPVLETLKEAGFSTSDAFESLEVRSAAAFAAIQNNPEIINELRESFLFTNAAAKANEVQMDALANVMAQFKNNLGILINNMAGPFVETLKIVLKFLNSIVEAFNGAVPVLKVLGTFLMQFGVAFAGLKLAFLLKNLISPTKAVADAVGTLAGTAKTAEVATTLLGKALQFLGKAGIWAVGLTVLTGAIGLMANAHQSLAERVDAAKNSLDEAKGVYDKTMESASSVEKEIGKLTERFAELNGKPSLVFTEMVSLQTQFSELGLKINNETNPSIYDLIDALKQLRGELAQTSLEQMGAMLSERALLLQAQAEAAKAKIGDLEAKRKSITGSSNARDYYGFSMPKTAAEKEAFWQPLATNANKRASDFATRIQGLDIGSLNQGQLGDLKKEVASISAEILRAKGDAAKHITQLRALRNTGQKYSESALTNYEASLESVTESYKEISNVASTISSYVTNSQEQIKRAAETTEVFQNFNDHLDDFNIAVSEMQDKVRNAKTDKERKEAEADLEAMIEAFDISMLMYLVDRQQEMVDGMLMSLPDMMDMSGMFDDLNIRLEGATHQARSKLNNNAKSTGSAVNTAVEKANNVLEEVKRAYEHVTDKLDTEIKRLDAIKRESTTPGSKMYGQYSDAEIMIFEQRQKALEAQKIKAKLDNMPKMFEAIDAKISAQGGGTGKNTKDRIKSEGELNATLEERRKLELEQIQLTDEYNAMMGIKTEANISHIEQIRAVIDVYREQMAVESQWGYGLKENVIKVLDTGRSSFKQFATDVVTGTESVSGAFKKMAASILSAMLDIATNKLASSVMDGIFGGGGGGFLGNLFGIGGSTSSTVSLGPSTIFSNYTGGRVKRAATGADIGRDTTHVLARPGEFIMRNSAVDMIGADNLAAINALGNRKISKASADIATATGTNDSTGQPSVVNVYVVSPDQKPSLTKQDVLVTVSDDLLRGGQIKKLVKSIVVGAS